MSRSRRCECGRPLPRPLRRGRWPAGVKLNNRKMIAVIDEPTLAEEAAMEAVATGARGYSNVEIKAKIVSEGGWQ